MTNGTFTISKIHPSRLSYNLEPKWFFRPCYYVSYSIIQKYTITLYREGLNSGGQQCYITISSHLMSVNIKQIITLGKVYITLYVLY